MSGTCQQCQLDLLHKNIRQEINLKLFHADSKLIDLKMVIIKFSSIAVAQCQGNNYIKCNSRTSLQKTAQVIEPYLGYFQTTMVELFCEVAHVTTVDIKIKLVAINFKNKINI